MVLVDRFNNKDLCCLLLLVFPIFSLGILREHSLLRNSIQAAVISPSDAVSDFLAFDDLWILFERFNDKDLCCL